MESKSELDESLYNRQLYVLGHDAMRRMGASNVLIAGMRGLGVEIAKNIILAGVKSVALHDDGAVEFSDLSAQFFLSEADVGKPRAASCVERLKELNQYVPVTVHSEPLTAASLKKFQVVVCADVPLEEQLRLDALCRAQGSAFIATEMCGVFGKVFCDFGDEFVVTDTTGENPVTCMVSSISQEEEGVVTVTEDSRHGLETGDFVTFAEVGGMEELNDAAPRAIKVLGPYTFSIGDTRSFGAYTGGGGIVTQVKQPRKMRFQPMDAALEAPGEILPFDFGKLERPLQLHLGFRALAAFRQRNGRLPAAGAVAEAEEVVALAREVNAAAGEAARVGTLDDEVLRWLALTARGQLSPMAAFLGGVVGQEVLKACSGKFTPIHQWFYFDAMECLPAHPLPQEEYAPTGTRYDGQVAVLGRSLQQLLLDLRYFLVGAGAIGCEMLKNWAMMGVACGEQGMVALTDMDRIERSNLSRQFLFRTGDIGNAKSVTAARAAAVMNPALRVRAFEERVGPDTEAVFDDDFFDSLSGVCTALDNVEARLYMDQRCVYYGKPLLESGTLGTKGNTQVVVPQVTENYGASRDPPERSIPICTLKNFPYAIEHTVQWARDWFEGTYKQAAEDVNTYLSSPAFLSTLDSQPNTKLETLMRVHDSLVTFKPVSFEQCVAWARVKFEELFANTIKQLLYNFPLDQRTASGEPFCDPAHLGFVIAAANLRAANYGLKGERDPAYFLRVLPTITVPPFSPAAGVRIAVKDSELKEGESATAGTAAAAATAGVAEEGDIDAKCAQVARSLPRPASLAGYRMSPLEFEKDDDSNHHMDLITAAANLRARNYKIRETDKHNAKLIAGKIIPAIATTTALVTGLVCMELYKLVQAKPLSAYRNAFVNLALPLFTLSEPLPPPKMQSAGRSWTMWDKIELTAPMTLQQVLQYFQSEHGLTVSMLSYGVSILYSFFAAKDKLKTRLPMEMSALAQQVSNTAINPRQKFLIFEVCCSDEDGEDVDVPFVRYRLR